MVVLQQQDHLALYLDGKRLRFDESGIPHPPTNLVGIKSFLLRKWTDNSDTTWAFDPNSDVNQVWPMNEQMRYSNATLKTAAMGGFPLGDLYRWWNNIPDHLLGMEGPGRDGRCAYSGWLHEWND